jgi:hypothetical protein
MMNFRYNIEPSIDDGLHQILTLQTRRQGEVKYIVNGQTRATHPRAQEPFARQTMVCIYVRPESRQLFPMRRRAKCMHLPRDVMTKLRIVRFQKICFYSRIPFAGQLVL